MVVVIEPLDFFPMTCLALVYAKTPCSRCNPGFPAHIFVLWIYMRHSLGSPRNNWGGEGRRRWRWEPRACHQQMRAGQGSWQCKQKCKDDLVHIPPNETSCTLVRQVSELFPHSSLGPVRCYSEKQVQRLASHVYLSLVLELTLLGGWSNNFRDQSPEHWTRDYPEKKSTPRQIMTQLKLKTAPLVPQKGPCGKGHLARKLTQNKSLAAQRCWRRVSEAVSTEKTVQ